jgi:hypothetical protein
LFGKFKAKRPFGGSVKIITGKHPVKVYFGLEWVTTGSYVGIL